MAMFSEIRGFCLGRVHNIWGVNRAQDNSMYEFSYDFADWYQLEKGEPPLFKLKDKSAIEFRYSDDKI